MSMWRIALLELIGVGLLATFGAMAVAWGWVYKQFRTGQPLFPPAKPREVPWGIVSFGAVVLTWVVVNLATVGAYVTLTRRPRDLPLSFIEQMTLVSLINGVLLVAVPVILYLTSGARLRDLGLQRAGLARHLCEGALAFLLVAIPINIINVLCATIWTPEKHPLEKMVRENATSQVAYLAFLSAVILAPAAEELIFRGVVQNWLLRVFRRYGPFAPPRPSEDVALLAETWEEDTPSEDFALGEEITRLKPAPRRWSGEQGASALAVVITSTVFALFHAAQWPAPIAIFFLSLALGFVYVRTGSLWASFATHALFNGLSTTFLFLAMLGGDQALKKAAPPGSALIQPAVAFRLGTPFTRPCSGNASPRQP